MFGMGVNRQSNKPHFLLLISFIFWSSYSSFVGHTWISSERTWMRRPNYTMRTKIFSSWDGGTRLALHLRAFNSIFAWKKIYEGTLSLQKCCRYWKCTKMISLTQMGTDKRVATPIPFVYWFGSHMLQSNKNKSYRGHLNCFSVPIRQLQCCLAEIIVYISKQSFFADGVEARQGISDDQYFWSIRWTYPPVCNPSSFT